MEWGTARGSFSTKMEDATKDSGVKILWMDSENFTISQIKLLIKGNGWRTSSTVKENCIISNQFTSILASTMRTLIKYNSFGSTMKVKLFLYRQFYWRPEEWLRTTTILKRINLRRIICGRYGPRRGKISLQGRANNPRCMALEPLGQPPRMKNDANNP